MKAVKAIHVAARRLAMRAYLEMRYRLDTIRLEQLRQRAWSGFYGKDASADYWDFYKHYWRIWGE